MMTSTSLPGTAPLRVLIADESTEALESLRAVLEDGLGHDVVSFAVSAAEAAALITQEDPDLAIVMVHHDDEHALNLISETVELVSGPVIAHANGAGADAEFAQRAAQRGVDAYVASSDPEDVQGAIEVALRRHRERAALAGQVDELEGALERRATIERAKGILMERHGVDERQAFEQLRSHARSTGTKVVAVAAAVAAGHALLPRE